MNDVITNAEMRLRKLAMLVEQMRDKQRGTPDPLRKTRTRIGRRELEARVDREVDQILDRRPGFPS